MPQLTTADYVKAAIKKRLQERAEREFQQRKLWRETEDYHETIRSKLDGVFEDNQFCNFARCGQEDLVRECQGCGQQEAIRYHCNLKWCPRCQWRLSEKRKRLLGAWTLRIQQPKHLVLTQKNFAVLTGRKIREHQKNLARMRRAKAMKQVKGGCVSIEITNEGNGWHLHSHWLIDVRWLDMPSVSQAWAKLVGQEFSIVKIMDCREKSYLQEVTKYVCEGSAMAQWPSEKIHEFVRAIKRRRFFFAFGSLFHEAADVRRGLNEARQPAEPCECGCDRFRWKDEIACLVEEAKRLGPPRASVRGEPAPLRATPTGDTRSKEAQPGLPGLPPDTRRLAWHY